MRTFGIRISFLFILTAILTIRTSAQYSCPCVQSECGGIIASFKLGGDSTVVCDGYEFLVINNSTITDVSYFIWDWGDGSKDSVTTTGNQTHIYNITDKEVCKKKQSVYEICLLAVKNCGVEYSCHSNRSPVTVIHRVVAEFEYINSVCINKKVDFVNKSCNVDEMLGDAYLWTFHDGTTSTLKNPSKIYTAPGTYNVNLKVKNSCGVNDISHPIEVVDYPDAVVKLSDTAKDSVVCVGDIITLTNQSNQWSNIQWKFPVYSIYIDTSNWKIIYSLRKLDSLSVGLKDSIPFIDTLVIHAVKAGTYIFEMTSSNACGEAKWKYKLKVEDSPTFTVTSPPQFCETGEYSPKVNLTLGSIKEYLWSFPGGNPTSSDQMDPGKIKYNAPGTYTVILRAVAECDTIVKTVQVVVNSRDPVNILDPLKVFCKGNGPDTLYADSLGGSWSGTGITNTGIFDPTNLPAGIYKIKYAIGPVGCQSSDSIDVEVVNSANVSVPDVILCENSNITQLSASPTSGIWGGNPAVDALGLFNPAISGTGIFNVSYTYADNNQCVINKVAKVTVESFPLLIGLDTSLVCVGSGMVNLEDILQINTNPTGGSLSFLLDNISVGQNIDLTNYIVGTLPVTIIYKRNECEVKDSAFIQFIQKPFISITLDTTICIDQGFFSLQANVNGGQWSGPGVNPLTGLIDLTLVGEGNKTYTYLFQPNTSCEQSLDVNINIIDPFKNLLVGPNQEMCQGSTSFTLTGNFPSGGYWSGIGINASTGIINTSQLVLDSIYSYSYCIKDGSIGNCEACKSKTFVVRSLPQSSISVFGLPCIGEEIEIAYTTPGSNTIVFNLSDGTTSTQDTFKHMFNTKGTYTIALEVTNAYGCKNTASEDVYVTSKPVAAFTTVDKEGCAPFNLNIQNQSTGDSILSVWNINNIQYLLTNPPAITLDNVTKDSTFIIQLVVSNLCGPVFKWDSVRVHPYPIVNFGISELQGCSPLVLTFSNTSLGDPATYYWDMGNGLILTDSLPTKQEYTTPPDSVSTYSILLVGINPCGIDSIIKEVTVYPPDVTAFIEAPGLVYCQYDSLRLESFSTPGAINTWKLISPDGSLFGASGSRAIFPLIQSGEYTAILFASRCGSDTDTIKITVNPAPFLDFEVPPFACMGSAVNFTNSSSDSGGTIWDFGDGSIGLGNNSNHAYTTPGLFTVNLTAYSLINNCPLTVEKQIKIIGLPNASFTPSLLSGCQPLDISFTNNSTPGSKYDWDFGDMTSNSSVLDPKHTFFSSGTFQVKLTVYDEYGCYSDTSILNVLVYPKPISDFTFIDKKYCHRYDTVQILNQSIGSVGQEWRVEGNTFATNNVFWIPTNSGNHQIQLLTNSVFGCKDTLIKEIEIFSSPKSSFSTNDDKGCEDLLIDFTNQSTDASQYIWDLDNGTTAIDHNLAYLFTQPGTFHVKLISISSNGCPNDTLEKEIIVYPKPQADFAIIKDSVCGIPMNVFFENLSTGNIDNAWFINGMEVGQEPNFTQIFNTPGKNEVNLLIQTEFLCRDTIQNCVEIYHQPIAEFELKDEACEDENVLLQNKSIHALQYIWSIQDQGMSFEVEPKIIFDEPGNYSIQLIAIYNEYCKDTIVTSVPCRIYVRPTAIFDYITSFDDNTLGEVSFENLSIEFNRLLWSFGDGIESEEEDPIHEYDINRDVFVTLTAFNDNNGLYTCIDSIIKPIAPEWITTFFAPNALSPEYGDGDVKVFKPVGVGLAKYNISVYSPWGEKVWQSEMLEGFSPTESWDGTYKGAIVPQGAYSWMADVTFVNGVRKVFKGSVTVVR